LNSQWFGKPEEKKKDSEAKSNQKNEPAKVGCFFIVRHIRKSNARKTKVRRNKGMLSIHKNYVLDEYQKPIAMQIPIEEFGRIEEILENYGLAKLMDETQNNERLSGETAYQYYQILKTNVEG